MNYQKRVCRGKIELSQNHSGRLVNDTPRISFIIFQIRLQCLKREGPTQNLYSRKVYEHFSIENLRGRQPTGTVRMQGNGADFERPENEREGVHGVHTAVFRCFHQRRPGRTSGRRKIVDENCSTGGQRCPGRSLTEVELQFIKMGGHRVARADRLGSKRRTECAYRCGVDRQHLQKGVADAGVALKRERQLQGRGAEGHPVIH